MGEGWNGERRYAFAQGFYAAKGVRELDFGEQSDQEAAELAALLKATRWVREVTNGCPQEIYPMSLAESALLLIRSLAGDKVTARITTGRRCRRPVTSGSGRWAVAASASRCCWARLQPDRGCQCPVLAALVGKGSPSIPAATP